MKAPLFPMEASEKGASGSQISPGEKKRNRFLDQERLKLFHGSSKIKEDITVFLFSVLGTFFFGTFSTSFFVPLLVNRFSICMQ